MNELLTIRGCYKLLVLAAVGGIVAISGALPQRFAWSVKAMQSSDAAKIEFFEAKVRPLLATRCYDCHSIDEIMLGVKYVTDPANNAATGVTIDEQKSGAWRYGQGDYDEEARRVKTFKPFEWRLDGEWRNTPMPGDPRTAPAILNSKGGLTYEGKKNALIRRWVAPFDGRVSISGVLEQNFENGCRKCEGVRGIVVPSRLGKTSDWMAGQNRTETAVDEIAVQRGDTIDFIVDASKGGSGNGFKWVVTIKRLDGNAEEWNSLRDFRHPSVGALGAWERYAQTLLAAAEFLMID
jgi:hypothetical protein